MAGQLDSLFKDVAKSVVAQLGDSFDHSITYTKKSSPSYNTSTGVLTTTDVTYNIKYAQYELARALANDTDAITGTTGKDGNFSEVQLGDLQVKYNTDSQGTGSINNILDVYPWLQSYLGAYMLGGAGSFQLRVVRG